MARFISVTRIQSNLMYRTVLEYVANVSFLAKAQVIPQCNIKSRGESIIDTTTTNASFLDFIFFSSSGFKVLKRKTLPLERFFVAKSLFRIN